MRPQRSTTLRGTRATVRTLLLLLAITTFVATFGLGSGTQAGELRGSNVTVSNQTIENGTLVVDRATLSDGGFLVVHGSRYVFDGIRSPIAVSAFLEAGTHSDVRVALPAEATTPEMGSWLAVVAHHDGGDREFEYFEDGSLDTPYRDTRGEVVDEVVFVRAPGVTVSPLTDPERGTNTDSRNAGSSSVATADRLRERRTTSQPSGSALTNLDFVGLVVGGLLAGCAALALVVVERTR